MNAFYPVVLLCAITLCTVCARASAADNLTLAAAVKATLDHNPQLAGYEFRVQALQGEQQTAALKPQLHATVGLENIAGSGEFKGAGGSELTLALSSVLELGGKQAARLGLVTARQQQLAAQQRVLTLDVLTQVTQQFIALAATQEQLKLVQQGQKIAQDNIHSLNRQMQAGRTPEAELLRAKAALARAAIDTAKAHQQLGIERLKLSAFWASSTPNFTQVQADLLTLPPLPALAQLNQQLANNPDLAVLADEVQVQAANVRQAQAEGKTNLEWSAGVRRLELSDDSALVVGLSMPLGAKSRASGALAAASAQQAGAEQERQAAQLKLTASLASVHAAFQLALDEVNSLRREVLPPLKQAMGATAEAFNQGRYSYLELNLAQRELLASQLALIDAAARAHTLNSELERLTGAALSTELKPNSVEKTQP